MYILYIYIYIFFFPGIYQANINWPFGNQVHSIHNREFYPSKYATHIFFNLNAAYKAVSTKPAPK